jgi:hypothetical protein
VDSEKLSEAFSQLAEKHVRGESVDTSTDIKADKITGERIEKEADKTKENENENEILKQDSTKHVIYASREKKKKIKNKTISHKKKSKKYLKKNTGSKNRITLDSFNKPKARRI